MLNSLLIRNFRIFKELKINKLSRVNLFVGKNNSGKSCLLEALQIYAAKGCADDLIKVLSYRDENIVMRKSETSFSEAVKHIGYFFNGYSLPEIDEEAIDIGPIENFSRLLQIHHRAFQFIEGKEGLRMPRKVSQKSIKDGAVDIHAALESIQGGKRCYLAFLDPNKTYKETLISSSVKEFNYNYQVVRTWHTSNNELSVLWDKINLTDLENEALSCLQVVDPNISGVAFVGTASDDPEKTRIPIIRYKGIKDRIPLKTMGDGLTRLFHIILALVNSKDGFLLIDEFENGLHWRLHPKIWDIIIRLSEELNVQVIATSHSRDCVKGFYEAWSSKEESAASFYRLEADPVQGAKAVSYTREMLSDAIETDVEVR